MAAAGAFLTLSLAACSPGQENSAMTPEQSRQKLISDITAVIRTLVPDASVTSFTRGKDTPCGGPVGTEHTRVRSAIVIHADAGIDAAETDIVTKARSSLESQGWKIGWNRKDGEISNFSIEKPETGNGLFGVSSDTVTFDGDTLCVDNPEY
ncbi:hypothetical protein HTZ77_09405 [Nonomuraea sp. SMC257]|uniref:Uncharacterized protein n=1 Tax=Nonomuraea montanisoli TaxID=2741721 RepID=A0A7Y6I4M9_9ACTN|nr:hypothetical protein [Nonomuraea montanisoli]NUW31642.1 hypothetical protein [Nonomuraea montanisoli]